MSPVYSKDQQVESYNKYRAIFRRADASLSKVSQDRDNKLKKFFKLKEKNYQKGVHKYLFKVTLLSIPRVPDGLFNTFWLEANVGGEKILTAHSCE